MAPLAPTAGNSLDRWLDCSSLLIFSSSTALMLGKPPREVSAWKDAQVLAQPDGRLRKDAALTGDHHVTPRIGRVARHMLRRRPGGSFEVPGSGSPARDLA